MLLLGVAAVSLFNDCQFSTVNTEVANEEQNLRAK